MLPRKRRVPSKSRKTRLRAALLLQENSNKARKARKNLDRPSDTFALVSVGIYLVYNARARVASGSHARLPHNTRMMTSLTLSRISSVVSADTLLVDAMFDARFSRSPNSQPKQRTEAHERHTLAIHAASKAH